MRLTALAVAMVAIAVSDAFAEGITIHEWTVYRVGPVVDSAPPFVIRRVAEIPSLSPAPPKPLRPTSAPTGDDSTGGATAPATASGSGTITESSTAPGADAATSSTGRSPAVHDGLPRVFARSVLFLSSDVPAALELSYKFPGGEPWASYPAALFARDDADLTGSFSFSGTIEPIRPSKLERAERTHWWTILRKAVPTRAPGFRSVDGRSERFLYLEGTVAYQAAFEFSRPEVTPEVIEIRATGLAERSLWLFAGGRASRISIPALEPTLRTRLGTGQDVRGFRRELERALTTRGLPASEIRAMLDSNAAALFEGDQPRAVYLVPRPLADAMLPVRIGPAAAATARVGLAIVDL